MLNKSQVLYTHADLLCYLGYHAITFGFLADQIVRRVDPKKRTVAQFYHDEIHGKETGMHCIVNKVSDLNALKV